MTITSLIAAIALWCQPYDVPGQDFRFRCQQRILHCTTNDFVDTEMRHSKNTEDRLNYCVQKEYVRGGD